ncbi:9190_t:CDS:2, partial [Gigaspora margarita]
MNQGKQYSIHHKLAILPMTEKTLRHQQYQHTVTSSEIPLQRNQQRQQQMIEKEKVQHKKKEISIQAPVKVKRQHDTNSTAPVHDFKQRKSESATPTRTTQTNDDTGKQSKGK